MAAEDHGKFCFFSPSAFIGVNLRPFQSWVIFTTSSVTCVPLMVSRT